MGSTLRRITGISGDRILIRNRWTFNPTLEVSENNVKNLVKIKMRALKKDFQ